MNKARRTRAPGRCLRRQLGKKVNRIYKTVWNEQTRTFVAVSELARARGKRSGSSVNTGAAASGTKLRGALALGAVALAGAGFLSACVSALADVPVRLEERRVGIECVGTGRSRWSAYHLNISVKLKNSYINTKKV